MRSPPRSRSSTWCKKSGEVPEGQMGEVVGRISFFVNAGMRFITEMCKMRAFVDMWDEITAQRYGINDPKQRLFRYGVQVNSLGLTEPQPENNVYRIFLEMLAVTLSKKARARAVQLPAWNEALGLPRPFDQQWSLRAQQILAYESDLLEYGDIFDGSTEIARKVEELKRLAKEELATIERLGGAVAAVEMGYMKQQLVESNTRRLESIEIERQHRGRRQQIHRKRTLAADRRHRCDHDRLARGGSRADRAAECLAQRARRQGGRRRAEGIAPRRDGRQQRHAGLDRLRQGRRHHRRMGRGVPRGVRRISRADRRAEGRASGRRRRCSSRFAPRSSASRTSSDGA